MRPARLAVLLTILLAGTVRAQQSPGIIQGQVTDRATGSALVQASVRVVETDQTFLTDTNGRYRTDPLPPATYTLEVTLLGYGISTVENVVVPPGAPVTRDAQLSSGDSPTAPIVRAGADGDPGRIGGQVVDQLSGRPLSQASILIVEASTGVLTDLSGRYRTQPLTPGEYTVEVSLLGYATTRVRGVRVTPGRTIIQNVALETEAVGIEGLVIEVEQTRATSTEAGLLSMQRAAAAVSDGISAEQISRSPDSNAGDALARVTGVSIVDDKFVIVRGLGERYSSTSLNGVEISSPEPTRRIVPMDVFPASLLESVVTTKAATPDKPGDFAGGAVEIKTKAFPDENVFDIKFSGGYSSLSTFKELPVFGLQGSDLFAFDGQNRDVGLPEASETFAESLRNVWSAPIRSVMPDLGFGLTWGGQAGEFENAFGWVFSVDYGQSRDYSPENFWAFVQDFNDGEAVLKATNNNTKTKVDYGIVANFSKRLGSGHTIGLRNLLTREAEEELNDRLGIDPENQGPGSGEQIQTYQVKYVTRTVGQSSLSGNHSIGLGGATLDWTASASYAGRDEPDSRSVNYLFNTIIGEFAIDDSKQNNYWFRFLDERTYVGQLDLTFPFSGLFSGESVFKLGARYRDRSRDFYAERWNLNKPIGMPGPDGEEVYALPPEQLFSPENIGRNVTWTDSQSGGLPYVAEEQVQAAYAMTDFSPIRDLRLVGGLRVEQWDLDVFANSLGSSEIRNSRDYLWSANATYTLSRNTNLRASGYRTLSRPDPRELSLTRYEAVSGQCETQGNPLLTQAEITNYDARVEWYPSPGELISVSGFYKDFTNPIIQVVSVQSLRCKFIPANAASAINQGAEVEIRKNLDFVTDGLRAFQVGANFTFTDGVITPDPTNDIGLDDLPLADQSRYLFNGNVGWASPGGGITATVLYNYFSDRVRRYGQSIDGGTIRPPDVVEVGRGTIDAKTTVNFWGGSSFSISAKNLTNQNVRWVQPTSEAGDVPVLIEKQGVSISLSAKYRIR